MMVHSSRVTRERGIDPEFYKKLGTDANSLYQNYFKIYFENSSKKRLLFFCDPLIQHMWGIFRDESAQLHKSYLMKVRQQSHGHDKVLKLIRDASLLQEAVDFQVFP